MLLRSRAGIGARRVIAMLCVAVFVTACAGSGPATTGGPSATAPSTISSPTGSSIPVTVVAPSLPPLDEAIPQAAEADVALVHGLQHDAGIPALLGADGEAALAAIDTAQTTFAETQLPALVEEMGIPVASAALIASVPNGSQGASSLRFDAWTPDFVGRPSYTASLLTAVIASSIANSDRSQARGSLSKTENYDSTTGEISEHISIRTTFTLQTGGGKFLGEVELQTTTTATNTATGEVVGTLLGTARGHIELNACPDPQGLAEGKISLAWQEDLTRAGTSTASAAASFDSPIKLIVGEDAHLIETQVDLGFSKGAHGPAPGDPSASFDWAVTGSMDLVLPGGSSSLNVAGVTAEGNGATQAQINGATTTALYQAGLIVREVASKAEEFWRSGKCIELKSSEESREVDPDEQISLSVDATHRFDGSKPDAPIVAIFSGKKSVEPADTPVDPPASFDFTAGHEPDEKGTIQLKQTSRRGIGQKTLEFTVAKRKLAIALDGTWNPPNANVRIVLPKQTLSKQDDGSYLLRADANVNGTVSVGGCSNSFTDSVALAIIVRVDEADSNLVRVEVRLDDGTGLLRVEVKCRGVTIMAPVPLTLWVISLAGPIEATIGQPTTVTGTGGSVGSTTKVTVTEEEE